ncbi:hypothetical protein BpHYR1_034768 [Brachionus plicatilis]|uniref:Uncharacterized protein n=1 Tax=Brachionus plicatilis TaxID=10195 RepID=A0A3M7S2B8_BRAPC|nr:hypothetical protein BpHYR1_034768 [Brachionus plicatilis]
MFNYGKKLKGLDDLEEDFFENFNSLKYLEVEFDDFDLFNNLINKNDDQFISKYNYLNEMKFLKISYKSNYKINFVKNLEEKKQLLLKKFNPMDEISVQIDCKYFQIDYENISSLNFIKIQTCKSPMECFETLKTYNFKI